MNKEKEMLTQIKFLRKQQVFKKNIPYNSLPDCLKDENLYGVDLTEYPVYVVNTEVYIEEAKQRTESIIICKQNNSWIFHLPSWFHTTTNRVKHYKTPSQIKGETLAGNYGMLEMLAETITRNIPNVIAKISYKSKTIKVSRNQRVYIPMYVYIVKAGTPFTTIEKHVKQMCSHWEDWDFRITEMMKLKGLRLPSTIILRKRYNTGKAVSSIDENKMFWMTWEKVYIEELRSKEWIYGAEVITFEEADKLFRD